MTYTATVLKSFDFDGFTIERIEHNPFCYGGDPKWQGRVVRTWRIQVPHPDVKTQTWSARTKVDAIKQGEWLRVGGGRDQATAQYQASKDAS
jgi:hypothetical protein